MSELEHSRSTVGDTDDDAMSQLMGETSCWTCGYRDSPAEIEACERAGAGIIGCPHRRMAGVLD